MSGQTDGRTDAFFFSHLPFVRTERPEHKARWVKHQQQHKQKHNTQSQLYASMRLHTRKTPTNYVARARKRTCDKTTRLTANVQFHGDLLCAAFHQLVGCATHQSFSIVLSGGRQLQGRCGYIAVGRYLWKSLTCMYMYVYIQYLCIYIYIEEMILSQLARACTCERAHAVRLTWNMSTMSGAWTWWQQLGRMASVHVAVVSLTAGVFGKTSGNLITTNMWRGERMVNNGWTPKLLVCVFVCVLVYKQIKLNRNYR